MVCIPKEHHGKTELIIMLAMLIGLMPATKYAKASYLMGAFVSGLTFCRSHELHHLFVSQFKRILYLTMKIFFAGEFLPFFLSLKKYSIFLFITETFFSQIIIRSFDWLPSTHQTVWEWKSNLERISIDHCAHWKVTSGILSAKL